MIVCPSQTNNFNIKREKKLLSFIYRCILCSFISFVVVVGVDGGVGVVFVFVFVVVVVVVYSFV